MHNLSLKPKPGGFGGGGVPNLVNALVKEGMTGIRMLHTKGIEV